MPSIVVHLECVYKDYPVIRGMLTYGVIWPTSCICQQTIAGKNWKTYDWAQAARFSLYGSCFVAPTLYAWIKVCSILWPRRNLETAIKKALIEQVTYSPAAIFYFFFGMSLLEGKSVDEAIEEVKNKFLFTYKVAVCVSSILQTIKFALISERNRTSFANVCNLIWTCFLAYMKDFELEEELNYSSNSETKKISIKLEL